MANVNEVKLCPHCEHELPLPDIERCPSCKALLRSPENKFFSTPDYLTMQLSDHLAALTYKQTPKERQDLTQLYKKSSEIYEHYYAWLKVMPKEDVIASFRDTRSLLQNLLVSNADIATIKIAAALGKDIGKLAKALEEYLSEGGQIINTDHIKQNIVPVKPEGEEGV